MFSQNKEVKKISGCVFLRAFLVSTADIKLPHHRLNLLSLLDFTPGFIVHLPSLFCSDSLRHPVTHQKKVWKEFPGVGTTVVLVKPSVVRLGHVCGECGLSSETVLFFT